MYADATMATQSHARTAGNASPPSPSSTIHEAIRMPPTIATIAQNSVVLNACFVSVVRRANTPTGVAEARSCCAFAATAPPRIETLHGPRVRPRYPCPGPGKRAEATHVRDQTQRQRNGNVEPLWAWRRDRDYCETRAITRKGVE